MFTFGTFILWLHILAVIVWVGGTICFVLVISPVLKNHFASTREFAEVLIKINNRFKTVQWEAIGVIILTGIFNLINVSYMRNFNFSSNYINFLVFKLILVTLIIVSQGIQNSVYGPRLISMARSHDQKLESFPESYKKIRRKIFFLLMVNIGFAAMVIYIGLGLKYM